MKILAPAKVNIGLRVYGRENSGKYAGFHRIESVFQTVSLFDEIEAEFSSGGGKIEIECRGIVEELPEENTLTKAFGAFRELTGLSPSVRVRLLKRIPAGGGLGGGSSDGAAFIRLLSGMCGIRLERKTAFSLAERIGSDVFFFLALESGFGAALVSGRGDVVREIGMRELHFVLIFPDVFSSTKEAYSLLDDCFERGESESGFVEFSGCEALYRGEVSAWGGDGGFRNSFTPVLCAKFPEIALAIGDLRAAGAEFADMTGSGAAVFGVFGDGDSARAAFSVLRSRWHCVLA